MGIEVKVKMMRMVVGIEVRDRGEDGGEDRDGVAGEDRCEAGSEGSGEFAGEDEMRLEVRIRRRRGRGDDVNEVGGEDGG